MKIQEFPREMNTIVNDFTAKKIRDEGENAVFDFDSIFMSFVDYVEEEYLDDE